jgi:hypothetical protein
MSSEYVDSEGRDRPGACDPDEQERLAGECGDDDEPHFDPELYGINYWLVHGADE